MNLTYPSPLILYMIRSGCRHCNCTRVQGSCLARANSIFLAKKGVCSRFVHTILAITGNCPRFLETTELAIKMGVEMFFQTKRRFGNLPKFKFLKRQNYVNYLRCISLIDCRTIKIISMQGKNSTFRQHDYNYNFFHESLKLSFF